MTDNQGAILAVSPERRVYASRTLNLRSIAAIGYDLDYTLVHYRVEAWEQQAYARLKELLGADGWPVEDLRFDPRLVIRGLVVDTRRGNIVKANRFGYVTKAFHGTRPLTFEEQRRVYRHTPVDLADPTYVFLNTLFSLSETCLYAQLVDLLDADRIRNVHGYAELFEHVRTLFGRAHLEGSLKTQIMADPERFVEPDPEAARTLLDQREAGKRLCIISNAEWPYARRIMSWAYDPFLPSGMNWRELFELVIVSARKPDFFTIDLQLFSIIDDDGLLRPAPAGITSPGAYLGGDASKVETYLGLSGSEILYVGDHIWADVKISKSTLRWRTALILRELEEEVAGLRAFRQQETELFTLMSKKIELESRLSTVRLDLQRAASENQKARRRLERGITDLRSLVLELDDRIAPLARAASEVGHPTWGPLLRAGNDKSHLAHQLERSADVYTSRVSNFLYTTPFAYLRSARGSMPHDPASGRCEDTAPC